MRAASAPKPQSPRKRVLLVVSPIWEESHARILKGIAQFQRDHTPWETQWDNQGLSLSDEGWFTREPWDGVISRHTNALQLRACAERGIPLVDVNDARPYPGIPNIALNNVAVGQLGGEHLMDRGFFHFGFAGFSNEPWSNERRDGFRDSLLVAGRSCTVHETVYPDYYTNGCTPEWHAAEIGKLTAWLRQAPRPFAVMACSDFRAIHVLRAAAAAGLRVPEDLAVLGANNDEVRCELTHPPLSSVSTNHQQSGYRAAEVLARLMDGRKLDGLDLVVDPLNVVSRQSTDVLAVDDPKTATAVRFIQQNATKGITVDQVGRHAGIARTQLEERFRKFFSRSPQAEIRRVQLERLRQLLEETDLPLRTIADITGFTHPEYLIVFFKREMGESPGRYRRRIRGQ